MESSFVAEIFGAFRKDSVGDFARSTRPVALKKKYVKIVQLPHGAGEEFAAIVVLPSDDISIGDVIGALCNDGAEPDVTIYQS